MYYSCIPTGDQSVQTEFELSEDQVQTTSDIRTMRLQITLQIPLWIEFSWAYKRSITNWAQSSLQMFPYEL